jgi:phosphoserine phosphatase
VTTSGFASVILDVDSTLCGIEGIDWLAERRGQEVAGRIADLTARAMTGEIALDSVYGERLALVRPTRAEIAALAKEYVASLAPHAVSAIRLLTLNGRRVVLVSGGIREAILLVATILGIPEGDVFAVSVHHDPDGSYAGYDTASPLATAGGKRAVAEGAALPARVLAMGDGATDLAIRPVVDAFAAFTGFVRRAAVVEQADLVIESFDQLVELVLE